MKTDVWVDGGDNVKMNLGEIGHEDVHWIELAYSKVHWWAFVTKTLNSLFR